ncbi:MAG: RNA polymerase subunit sigma-54 [Candidatus Entotheonella factor]|uniref:RNA polymerase subunit sigma-54 n=1 Tax=Entotheonella factor TaxID=1429438 RepID=W4LXH9_ENTF1|nr:sigma 54-interacting transcriptional regulator [Candidatus Entotheonella palauensis]ETX02630.1 MAG: RNA polymerase subunit sigma-54 [Candidatus Entotheonella factor]
MHEPISTWLHFFGQSRFDGANEILRALEYAGLEPHLNKPQAPNGLGVLCFDTISSELCDYLRMVSHGGAARVLAVATPETAITPADLWPVLQAGASDAFLWHRVPNPAAQIAARLERWQAVDQVVESPLVTKNLVGNSVSWKSILRQIVEVACYTDASVLILGESGTGKELLARLIHTLDKRPKKGELIILDCTTIVPELSGSEFFGHERDAYTGATGPRDGAFCLAHGGSLFLDEVGELPPVLQAQLLRVVQERSYKRVGGNEWHQTEFRLICATNRDLAQEVADGQFRSDLYYRIAAWVCQLPPLSERPDDILPLTRHFLRELRPDREVPELDEPVLEYLLNRSYPGNVRELKQLVTRMSHLHVGDGPMTLGDLPEEERMRAGAYNNDWRDERLDQVVRRAITLGAGLKEISQYAADTAVRIAVGDEEGNLQRAAMKLGVTDRALQMRRTNQRH